MRKAIPRFFRLLAVKRVLKGRPMLDDVGNHDARERMPIGTCLRTGSGKRFPTTIPRAVKGSGRARSAAIEVDEVEDAAIEVVAVETNAHDRMLVRRPLRLARPLRIVRLEKSAVPLRPHPLRGAILVSDRAVRDVAIVPVTIADREKIGRVANVVRNGMIAAATKLGRPGQPVSPTHQQHLQPAEATISVPESSRSNPKSRRHHPGK